MHRLTHTHTIPNAYTNILTCTYTPAHTHTHTHTPTHTHTHTHRRTHTHTHTHANTHAHICMHTYAYTHTHVHTHTHTHIECHHIFPGRYTKPHETTTKPVTKPLVFYRQIDETTFLKKKIFLIHINNIYRIHRFR